MRIVYILAPVWIVWFFLSLPSHARDLTGQYANSPNKEWFASQHNNRNVSCCEVADGHHLDDTNWKADQNGDYWVKDKELGPDWVKVPDYAIINPKDRPVDYAVVWIYGGTIYCFMAGAGT